MDLKTAQALEDLLEAVVNACEATDNDARKWSREILTHLSRINSTLSAIDRKLTLLEMKK